MHNAHICLCKYIISTGSVKWIQMTILPRETAQEEWMTNSADLDRLLWLEEWRMTDPNASRYDMPHAASITVQIVDPQAKTSGQDTNQDRSSNLWLLCIKVCPVEME